MTDPAAERTADARATDAVTAGEADTPDEADFRPLSLPRIAARLIALAGPAFRRSWWLLTVVALLASVDEHLEIHERFDVPGDRLAALLPLDVGFTRVLVGGPIALVIGLLVLHLVLPLPRRALIKLFQHDAASGQHRLDPAVQRRAPRRPGAP
ncbi:hypothetical protein [Brachybacterium atlanticum]|uniref:hypothetical protein n=1 Tax=Brachybacterium atlanticum TaxID=2911888 RepID=UPI0021E0C814|nr:hypothetical protein [Brachybacterium atlanticum]